MTGGPPTGAADNPAEPMAVEFDTVAGWTADVAFDLGPEYHVPAGCRGSGSPSSLTWLIDRLRPEPAERMLDLGAGVGGPAAFLAAATGGRPVLTEPEPTACRAARRLFDLPVVQAGAPVLPFVDGAFELAWCLGVLCTAPDQPGLLAELRRVLAPTGRLGLLVFVATVDDLLDPPVGNNFPTESGLRRLLAGAGFQIVEMVPDAVLGDDPPEWRRRTAAIEAELRRRHQRESRWLVAAEQGNKMGRLLATGDVRGTLVLANPR